MIIGTAGHIDHGKTTLVQALTGTHTDRLPEEKKRGISIELGYAFAPLPGMSDRHMAFIDVPGHERLVHTMVAGASGMDFALLLVAADDGPMPQTLEHLAVLSLLGIARGAIVITKADRADTSRIAQVEAAMRALIAPSTLAHAPILTVSAHTGQGIEALRALLLAAATQHHATAVHVSAKPLAVTASPDTSATSSTVLSTATPDISPIACASGTTPPHMDTVFRMPVDRVFTLAGTGTVVTGTIHSGHIQIGDQVCIPSSGLTHLRTPLLARVRSLHAQNQAVEHAHTGQRCAIALAGIAKDDMARGQWLVHPAIALQTVRLDAHISLWHGAEQPLKSGTRVHLHMGTDYVTATVAVLAPAQSTHTDGVHGTPAHGSDCDNTTHSQSTTHTDTSINTIAPGQSALVQLLLQRPLPAWHGLRLLLRHANGHATLAGGVVLDPFAPTRYRRTPQRLATLAAWMQPSVPQRLSALLAISHNGLDAAAFAQSQALPAIDPRIIPADTLQHGTWLLGAAHIPTWLEATLAALTQFHQQQPDEPGPDTARLRRLAAPRLPLALWQALLARWIEQGHMSTSGACIHLPTHSAQLSASDTRLAQKLAPVLTQARFEGAWARDLARHVGESEPLVRTTLARLARRGELHQVVRDLFYDRTTMQQLAALARQTAQAHNNEILAAQFRDATGLGRKRAIHILEYFDRIGLTRRVGDRHILRSDSTWFNH